MNRSTDNENNPLLSNGQTEPWHGRHVYRNYYPDDYRGCRGFATFPLAFWCLIFGLFLPVIWLVGGLLVYSRNPFERLWAKTCITAFFITLILFIIFGPVIFQ